jgi:hypothetical protein
MITHRRLAFLKSWLIPLGIFALALTVRVAGLGAFDTTDEPLWVARSQPFLGGLLFPDFTCPPANLGREFPTSGLACTLQAGYPGVTTMWGGSLGLLGYYWQVVRPTGEDLRTFLERPDLSGPDVGPALIAWTRLPMAVVAALFVLLFYWLVRRVLDERLALVAALLVALSPFHIALSRVLHQDALTANFMILSLLCMIGYWLQGWGRRWLLVSAVFAGIGFLAKAVSWFMMPCAAMIGLLSLYYRWRRGASAWRGWRSIGQMVGEGVAWGVVAWLSFAALFPAVWVIPGAVIHYLIDMSFGMAEQGHLTAQYFLGGISHDPGPLYYPIGWFLATSPLEVLGLLALPLAAWRFFHSLLPLGSPRRAWVASLRDQVTEHPAQVALALFLITFFVFETLSKKKMVRFSLPAFPVIDIFVAIGLLWLADRLARLTRREAVQRWALPALGGLVLLGQGWLVADNYPYYFTYYNPLAGGAPGAAQVMDVGWGEGLNEAAAYIRQQPGSDTLQITSDYRFTLSPFLSPSFAGEIRGFDWQLDAAMRSDYLVFYRRHLQGELHDPNLWRYFDEHYTPIQRVTLHGLDYALIYRGPVEQHLCSQDNSIPDVLTPFGYNLAADGALTFFWQNLAGGDRPEARAGLTSAADGETRWAACAPAPEFAAEAATAGAFVESRCSLAAIGALPGYYDLRLDIGSGGRTVTIRVDKDGRFSTVAPATAAVELARQGLIKPLDAAFGAVGLAGYRLEPSAAWKAGGEGALVLVWQLHGGLDPALADQFQVSLRLFAAGAAEPSVAAPHPILKCLTARDVTQGTVIPVRYPLPLPATLPPGEYTLQACLVAPGGNQTLDCLPLPVKVIN